jgi:hypothetical protein
MKTMRVPRVPSALSSKQSESQSALTMFFSPVRREGAA